MPYPQPQWWVLRWYELPLAPGSPQLLTLSLMISGNWSSDPQTLPGPCCSSEARKLEPGPLPGIQTRQDM